MKPIFLIKSTLSGYYYSRGTSPWNNSDAAWGFTRQEAEAKVSELQDLDRAEHAQAVALGTITEAAPLDVYELVDVDTLPTCDAYLNGFTTEIPGKGRDVELVYRSGLRCGVFGDFLHHELTRSPSYFRNPAGPRWRYTGGQTGRR